MTAEQTEPWVSMKDVQEHLGVRRETIAGWIAHRGMPAFKVGRVWKFKISEVDEWIKSGEAAQEKESGLEKDNNNG